MPKCEATTYPCFWWNPDSIDFKDCTRNASVEIDGINLCLQHAGTIAVIKLISQGNATKLSSAPSSSPLCSLDSDNRWKKKVQHTNKQNK